MWKQIKSIHSVFHDQLDGIPDFSYFIIQTLSLLHDNTYGG